MASSFPTYRACCAAASTKRRFFVCGNVTLHPQPTLQRQGGIADLLEVEPITLSRMIDRLQEAGLVERRADPNDRRAWQLFLTDKAAPIIAQLRDYAEELFVDALDGFSEAEEQQLNALLARVHQNLQNLSQRSDECGVRAHG
ncbi:MAG: MarR family transcriptional regulator [Rhodospirillaceae bacterium]|nr:MarR family transcriptional regulator [Rhodospirillaceae bacterium]